jgi:paraquat-inducible protein A
MAELISCRVCGQPHAMEPLPEGTTAECSRCHSTLAHHTVGSLHRTAAFALAALILYIPANLFPILRFEIYGAVQDNTVWQGCVRLWQDGDVFVAIIVFLASMLIPLLKLLGLFFLVITTQLGYSRGLMFRTWITRFIETIGRWAMLDVFVLAVLVSLVKLKRLGTVIPGPGLFAFTAVVVLTLLASASFDPRLIWKEAEENT